MAFSQPFPLASTAQKAQQPTYGPDLAVRLICPDCRDPNPNIIEEFGSGDLVCGGCGLVLGDRIVDTRSEWRVSTFSLFSFCFCDAAYDVFPLSYRRLPTTKGTTLLVLVLHQTLC